MKNFVKGRVYYHKKTIDIHCEAVSRWYEGTDYVCGKFRIFNRHNGVWYETKKFKISKKDLKNWLSPAIT